MSLSKLKEKAEVWLRVYRRIRFFKKMYPISSVMTDIFLLPRDYFFGKRRIKAVRNLTVAVTHRCNLRCNMCYFHSELDNSKELSLEVFKKIIDELRKSRPCVILSGGEPLMHPQILDMVRYAKNSGLPVQVFSNGTLLSPGIIDSLIQAGLDYMDITLLGDDKTHSLIAGSKDAYPKLIRNLEYFSSHRGKTKVVLNFTVTPEGLEGLRHAVELTKRYLLDGLRVQHYNFLTQEELSAQKKVTYRVFDQEVKIHAAVDEKSFTGIAERLISLKEELSRTNRDINVQWAPDLSDSEIRNWYSLGRFEVKRKCLFPWRGILVDASGLVYPCSKIYLELGDCNFQDIFAAWNGARMLKLREYLKVNLFPACSRCCKL